jgi:hypothetical protein
MKRIGKSILINNLPDTFPIQTVLKEGDALSPLLSNCALEYAIKKVKEDRVRLKLNGLYQLLICADNLNLLGNNNINTYLRS